MCMMGYKGYECASSLGTVVFAVSLQPRPVRGWCPHAAPWQGACSSAEDLYWTPALHCRLCPHQLWRTLDAEQPAQNQGAGSSPRGWQTDLANVYLQPHFSPACHRPPLCSPCAHPDCHALAISLYSTSPLCSHFSRLLKVLQ